MVEFMGQEFKDLDKLNKLRESHELFIGVVEGKKIGRLPTMAPMLNWIFHYSGRKMQQAIWNHEHIAAAFGKFLNDFSFDILFHGYYQDAQLQYILGNERNNMFDENMETLQTADIELLKEEEYEELIADPYLFIINKVLPRKYKRLALADPYKANVLAEAAIRFLMNSSGSESIKRVIMQRGVCCLRMGSESFFHPLDLLIDWRGIKGLSMDLRRRPGLVKEAVQSMFPLLMETAMPSAFNPNVEIITSYSLAAHFLNVKSFEEIYWPTYRQQIETFVGFGKKVFIWLEGDWIRFYDHLSQLPPHSITLYMEIANLKLAKSKFQNKITVAGGMPVTMLGKESKEKCIDYTKKLIDELAPGGGYIFSFDKLMNTKNDCNPENLKAVLETVYSYGTY